MLFPMKSLRQIGSGMFSACAGRGRPGCAEKRFLINLNRNFWIGLGAENLTDERYQESSTLNPAPGRLWYVEAGARL